MKQIINFLMILISSISSASTIALPPLSTMGNLILDSKKQPVHLHCTAWSGAHMQDYVVNAVEFQSIRTLVDFIKLAKFNCVRLEFSAEMVYKNPVIDPQLLKDHNKDLVGLNAIDVYARIVKEITSRKIMVILDLHMLDAGWCCDHFDDNGGWSNDRWTEQNVTDQLLKMVSLTKDNPYVVGVDLRNEIRPRIHMHDVFGLFKVPSIPFYPNWGLGGNEDWAAAAERMGNAVHTVNPNLLTFIQGIFVLQPEDILFILTGGSLDKVRIPQSLKSVKWHPINLKVPNRVVYSAHEYVWHYLMDFTQHVDYNDYRSQAEKNYGYVFDTYPLWIGEFGIGANEEGVNSQYWRYMIRYFQERKFHWAVWEFAGVERGHGDPNSYAVMNRNHTGFSYIPFVESLQSIMF